MTGHSFSSHGFCEIAFDVDASLAVRNALEILSDVVVGSRSIGIETVILRLKFNGLSVEFDGLFIFFACEGFVTLFFPVFS